MSLTRLDYRTRVLKLADAEKSGRWDTTPGASGEVDQHLGIVHAKEWKRILNAMPYYRTASYTPTADSNGRILFSALSDTSNPDAAKSMYRILQVAVNNVVLREVKPEDYYATQYAAVNTGAAYGVYYRDDAGIVCPGFPNALASSIRVNHTPTRADRLSSDMAVVEWPDDYEDVLVYEAAARLLSKGGAETEAAAELRGYAEDDRKDMLQDLARTTGKPLVMQYPDYASEWGGI